VERHSSPTDHDDARLRSRAFYQRTDELAVLLARAITRGSWSAPGALPQIG
jgi:hypothetical protein